ncbi:CoA transferase [Microbacterium sp. GCS4]|uniref:CoA transferase n=1 Tax=Microbacterium sp. GCS4 TaxID=1692239 RepID=UPI0009E27354|nr:CoA transferase [Microbacterium sp. GCS4]
MSVAAFEVLSRVAGELGIPTSSLPSPDDLAAVPLPSRLACGDLASASVSAVALASGVDPALIDGTRVAAAYRSDRLLTLDGSAPSVWSPYSGFWPTGDGWIRTHGNYPHHAAALVRGLGLPEGTDADALAAVVSRLTTSVALTHITAAGGLAVSVDPEDHIADTILRAHPLVEVERVDGTALPREDSPADGDGLPLAGIRVLDLTRVIAGPVATRTLALLGADVLRIDPPMLAEPEWQHLDTGHGKRSALLDARSPRMSELVEAADVVVLGYRPASIARLGLAPAYLLARNPRLIVGQLSAWGEDQPDAAGFDSLVQASAGISWVESSDGIHPGALPAQALDHSAGYLLAAAITALLRKGGHEGRSSVVRTSLRRVAAELLGMPRRAEPVPASESRSATGSTADPTARFLVDGRRIVTARSALPGFEFEPPHAWGSDHAGW